jgi:hypothetical protein
MQLPNFFKWFWAIPAVSPIIVSRGALVTVNIFQALGKTCTGKVVGDAKVGNSFNEFFDDWTCGEVMADAFSLLIDVVVRQWVGIAFEYPHLFNVLTALI